MFGKKKQQLRKQYDTFLLDVIERAKAEWDHAQETEEAVQEVDGEIVSQTAIAKQKYLFLFREARRRGTRGTRIQATVYQD
ncbi:hypothetical protein LOSG293_270090 [Secundilactobacillus oryzae JCM 18671]|uniref:DUF2508 domain-containing protein n=1 Tax=Secundilactobacillus oryzae JCM 18671 TaxID=1291743 RepID=A0A081BK06_9LACO|nr:YaaL family protein [Secundilactobacillus oryzae]GAK48374.1 hypothetical protein LOSG293_270090 [Secundilactobacillus oryzae JCM 18671]